ncbi:MAG: SIR2 family protein [Thermoleophilia bacterium]|nr:SIR2 family protein [Thermoleophilia bacterium]
MEATRALPRLIILGAGFSKPAGLPLSTELLDLVLTELHAFYGRDTHLHRSLPAYLDFVRATSGTTPEPIDIEAFAAYLDYRHVFGVLGSDTWSQEGNRDQFLLRWGIGRVLHLATPREDVIPDLYLEFARRLRPRDVVVSFNYDLLLERSLEHVGQPYRRFPHRLSSVSATGGIVDCERDEQEVTIVKPHGSLDWVSKAPYERKLAYMERSSLPGIDGRAFAEEQDPLFGSNACSPTHQVVEGPRLHDDSLIQIYTLEDLDTYYANQQIAYSHPPLVLAPSDAKQLYGATLRDLWTGIALGGFGWGGISVIGYSLPIADPYAQQILYEVVRGYQTGLEDPGWRIGPMHSIGLVDKRSSSSEREDLEARFRFLPSEYTRLHLDGFDLDEAMDVIFPDTPIAMPVQQPSTD